MKAKTCTYGDTTPLIAVARGPAFPKTGSEVVRSLKAALDRTECPLGGSLTQKRFAELIGIAKSTINDWYHSPLVDQIRGFLCALERLGEEERADLLRQLCRDCFRLDDPRISHDRRVLNALIRVVQQRSGITFIASRSDSARTFLITALGNSASGEIRTYGIDAHKPDAFVPVSGVLYLRRSCSPGELGAILSTVLPLVADSDAQLLLFNGIWSTGPDTRAKIAEMARRRNVFIANDFGNSLPRLCDWPEMNSSLILVNWAEREGGPLHISIQGHAQKVLSERLS